MPRDINALRPPAAPKPGFAHEEHGGILVFWALFLAVAFGFAALIFDLGRVANTQTELQSFADQVALAAAGELDGRPDAILRATTAGNALISRDQTFGDGARKLSGAGAFTPTFMGGPDGPVTNSDAAARFVRVQVNQTTVATPFAAVNAALIGRRGENVSSDVGAVAVAGRSTFACDITPLFFCLPDPNWRASANVGNQIRMVAGSSSGGWGPGNFGFLDPTVLDVDLNGPCIGNNGQPLTGANLYRCLVGAERGISQCIETTQSLETRPGQAVGLTRAFNTRFDIYQGSMNRVSNDPNYRPAPNVLRHEGPDEPSSYSNDPPLNVLEMLEDSCIRNDPTCRFGDGDWARDMYLETFHNGLWPIAHDPRPSNQISLRANATRHDVYLAEVASARARGDAAMPTAPGMNHFGRPGNHSFAQNAADRETLNPARRNVIAAAVDCSGESMNGRTDVHPLEYVRLFLTHEVQEVSGAARIRAEVLGSAGGQGSGAGEATYHEVIQLVR